ncbi:hypothetical protein [Arcobacter aquimarinus]|uniref:hypothetical protein n=1 Tax=Arcobacter aquimarinus TaxID=1315211 RepID=UPI003BB05127
MKRLFIIVGLIVSLFSGCGASSDTPQEIIKFYFEAALNGELDKANSYFSKNASDYSKKSLYKKINNYNNFVKDNEEFEFEFETTIDKEQMKQIAVFLKNDTATTDFLKEHNQVRKFTDNKFEKYVMVKAPRLRFDFVLENGSWKIKTAG